MPSVDDLFQKLPDGSLKLTPAGHVAFDKLLKDRIVFISALAGIVGVVLGVLGSGYVKAFEIAAIVEKQDQIDKAVETAKDAKDDVGQIKKEVAKASERALSASESAREAKSALDSIKSVTQETKMLNEQIRNSAIAAGTSVSEAEVKALIGEAGLTEEQIKKLVIQLRPKWVPDDSRGDFDPNCDYRVVRLEQGSDTYVYPAMINLDEWFITDFSKDSYMVLPRGSTDRAQFDGKQESIQKQKRCW